MNSLEKRYADTVLEPARLSGEIRSYAFESIAFRLADRTFYHPDFKVVRGDDYMEIHEVKGHWTNHGRAKIKIAAELNPEYLFKAVRTRTKKAGGGWQYEEF